MSVLRLFPRTALVAGLVLAGCASHAVRDNFGLASSESRERQIQNPEQSEVRNPVDGLGATTAADVVKNYHANQSTERQAARQDRARDSGISEIDN